MKETIEVDGVKYRRETANGRRAVVVVDRGWIWAGDVEERGYRILLTRAVWVFRWKSIGFDGVLRDPAQAEIRKVDHAVDIPRASEIFRVPVADDWGL